MAFLTGLISVIMSNYNTPEQYLRQAIESVLSQTYRNFEFIIIDDCSTDKSLDVITSYSDERIKVFKNDVNLGITKSLNKGLCYAKGEFVARMDADDICHPQRFEKQLDFLQKNPQVIVCGAGVELFGDGAYIYCEKQVIKALPAKEEFQVNLLFGNHTNIIHPTAMFRRSSLVENNICYNEKYKFAQDYRIWVDCSRIGECKNVGEVLLKYRIHNKAVSSDKKQAQEDCAKQIMQEQLSWLRLDLPDDWQEIHYGFFVGRKKYNLNQKNWIKKLILHNKIHKVYNQEVLEDLLWKKWAEISYFALAKTRNPIQMIKILFNLPIKYWGEFLKIKHSRKII